MINQYINAERSRNIAIIHTAALRYELDTAEPPTSIDQLVAAGLIEEAETFDPITGDTLTMQDVIDAREGND